jgi:CxxC motif-containing protein
VVTLKQIVIDRLNVEGLEDVPDEVIRDTLESIDGTLAEKIDAIAGLLNAWQRHEEGIAEEIKRLQNRKAVFGNRSKRLREYLLFQMKRLNNPKVETDLHTVSVRGGIDHVVIDNEELIPETYFKVVRMLNKTKLKAALKEGQVVGAHLEKGEDFVVVK